MTNYVHYVRILIGILGNAASLLLYGAPIVTFKRVIKKGSTEDFSGLPYAIALLNCLLYTSYGLPLISNGSENILVSTVNGVGIILELLFICIYLKFAPVKSKLLRKITRIYQRTVNCRTNSSGSLFHGRIRMC